MKALLLVDVQNDFLSGGSLAVPGSEAILPAIKILLKEHFHKIVASRDWHTLGHVSFAETHGKMVGDRVKIDGYLQTLWPVHCVQNTFGAAFSKEISTFDFDKIIDKGVDPFIDSYSAFYDNQKMHSTGLTEYFRANKITEIVVVGLATEICVRHTVIDALEDGFVVTVVLDGCKGLEIHPGDIEKALSEMRQAGAGIISLGEEFFYES